MRHLLIGVGILLLLAGCTNPRQRKRLETEAAAAPPPPATEVVVPTPEPEEPPAREQLPPPPEEDASTPQEVDEPAPVAAEPAPPRPPRSLAILLSDDHPEYGEVASELAARAGPGRTRVYNLDGNAGSIPRTMAEIQESEEDGVVAIGLLAAAASRRLTQKQVLFCQVFNHQDHDLVGPNRKGVAMIPPPSTWMRTWKEIDPRLRRIGVITGSGHEARIAAASAAAEAAGLELEHRRVSSDREAIYELRRLLTEIDGLWLLPDNRILSRDVLREIMSLAGRHGKTVLVNNPQLLAMGGLLSVSSRGADVADVVYRRLEEARDRDEIPGPDLAPLHDVDLIVNGTVADQLGLTVPAKYRGFVRALRP